MKENGYIVVVGALNVDLGGFGGPGFRLKDSIPGRIQARVGGVGCNIALALSALGADVRFLTILGDDAFAGMAREQLRDQLSLSLAFTAAGRATSSYLFINDDHGDLVAAVNDMDILQEMNPQRLAERAEVLAGASLLVLDANLSEAAVCWLCSHVDCPVLADPVSVGKAGRLSKVLNRLDVIKPNILELEYFCGQKIKDEEEALGAARILRTMGPSRVFVSLGEKGMVYVSEEEEGVIPSLAARIESTNGAGDTALAVLAYLRQTEPSLSARDCCIYAQLGSAIRMEQADGWVERLSAAELKKRKGKNGL